MELSQLRYFLKVAEHSSVTRASDELGITQPALSRAIGKLETELGQPLFERQTRRMTLTDAGRILQARAEQILTYIDDTVVELADNGQRGRIRVGAIPTVAPFFLPGVLRTFHDESPEIYVAAIEETTDKLLHRCGQGELDVAILATPVPAKNLQSEPLFKEDLLAVLPAGHPLAAKPQVKLAELREQPFVLLDETHCLSDTIMSLCRQRSFQPISVEHTTQLTMVEELVALGHGVSLIPRMARNVDNSDRRVYRPVARPTPTRTIAMVWNPYRFQSSRVEKFKACLRRVAREFARE